MADVHGFVNTAPDCLIEPDLERFIRGLSGRSIWLRHAKYFRRDVAVYFGSKLAGITEITKERSQLQPPRKTNLITGKA